MKNIGITLAFLVSYVYAIGQYDADKTAAILFTNSAYSGDGFDNLVSPTVDMTVMYQFLHDKLKIDCVKSPNFSTRKNFFIELNSFITNCKKKNKETVIVYYSGHGVNAAGDDFIVPLRFSNSLKSILDDVPQAELKSFIQHLFQDSNCASFSEKNALIDNNIIKGCIPICEIIDSLKDFNVLFISDACRTKVKTTDIKAPGDFPVNLIDDEIKSWAKNNYGRRYTEVLNTLAAQWRQYYDSKVQKKINKFYEYSILQNNLENKPKSVGLIKSTNAYNESLEVDFQGLFTNCFIQQLSAIPSKTCVQFGGSFWNDLQNCIDRKYNDLPRERANIQRPLYVFSDPVNNIFLLKELVVQGSGEVPNHGKSSSDEGALEIMKSWRALENTIIDTLKIGKKITCNYKISYPTKRLDIGMTVETLPNSSIKQELNRLPADVDYSYAYKIRFNFLDINDNIIFTTDEIVYKTNRPEEESFFVWTRTFNDLPVNICNSVKKIDLAIDYQKLITVNNASLPAKISGDNVQIFNFPSSAINLSIADPNDFRPKFLNNRTDELTLSNLGREAFEKEDYEWSKNFFKQCKIVESSRVWMANYPFFAADYFATGHTDSAIGVLNEMSANVGVPYTYLGHNAPIGFLLNSLKSVRDKVSNEHKIIVDRFIDSVLLKKQLLVETEISLRLGLHYGGGIIFYLDASGKHGLVAAMEDQSEGIAWSNGKDVSTGAKSEDSGRLNTQAILVAQGNAGYYAAKICSSYRGGGFSDWYLPSKNELAIMYSNRNVIGGFKTGCDENNFGKCSYWSSTENGEAFAWSLYFNNGVPWNNYGRKGLCAVRAIRAF